MLVEVSCKKCGQRTQMDIGAPTTGALEDYLHLLTERLSHKPSFECFGGHFEFAPPLPQFWDIHWDTLREK
jgi:hypothetical protein